MFFPAEITPKKSASCWGLGLMLFCFSVLVWPQSLPDPLDLKQAFSLAVQYGHPELEKIQQQMEKSIAEQQLARSNLGIYAQMFGSAEVLEPQDSSSNQDNSDYALGILVKKRLLDFGRTSHGVAAKKAEQNAYRWEWVGRREQHLVEVMAGFFDVILADLQYVRDNEAMAIAYVRFKDAQDRHAVGKLSEVDMLEKESIYHNVRSQRADSESKQHGTRSRLAYLLNADGPLPNNLIFPQIDIKIPLPEAEELQQQAVQHNPGLKALQARIETAQQQLGAVRSERLPLFSASAQVGTYQRDLKGRDKWRVGIEMEVPLWQGGRVAAKQSQAQAELAVLTAEYQTKKMQVQQAVLELWLDWQRLQSKLSEMQTLTKYRDLYMERSRARYEVEIQTDLGNAMALTSDAKFKLNQTLFEMTLVRSRLDVLTAKTVNMESYLK